MEIFRKFAAKNRNFLWNYLKKIEIFQKFALKNRFLFVKLLEKIEIRKSKFFHPDPPPPDFKPDWCRCIAICINLRKFKILLVEVNRSSAFYGCEQCKFVHSWVPGENPDAYREWSNEMRQFYRKLWKLKKFWWIFSIWRSFLFFIVYHFIRHSTQFKGRFWLILGPLPVSRHFLKEH